MRHRPSTPLTFLEWLGFKKVPDLSGAEGLGRFLGFFLSLLAIFISIAALATLFDFLQAVFGYGRFGGDKNGESIRNIGLVLAALFGGPFIIWRSFVAAKQASIADEALFNDKINIASQNLTARREVSRSVGQDGKEVILNEYEDDLVTRVAAIDRLEGLVSERNSVAPRVVRLLATYVRGNFPHRGLNPTDGIETRKIPRMDLQKAIDAIGRVNMIAAEVDRSPWRLDLEGCDFDGVNFATGYFRAVNFSSCRFEASVFSDGNFEGCYFLHSLMNYSDFKRANLRGAKFDRVTINRPIPVSGGFVSSINLGDITGATFIAADISALDYLGNSDVIAKTFGTADTKLSLNLRSNMLNENDHSMAHNLRIIEDTTKLSKDQLDSIKKLEETGFQNWAPFDSNDMALGWMLERFYSDLDMKKWPYMG